MGVYLQTADSCAADVPVKYELPVTAPVVDTCTHKSESNTIATEVAACKALTADNCSSVAKCRIATAKEICFQEKTFLRVKWIPETNTAWFSGNDDLKGALVVGT